MSLQIFSTRRPHAAAAVVLTASLVVSGCAQGPRSGFSAFWKGEQSQSQKVDETKVAGSDSKSERRGKDAAQDVSQEEDKQPLGSLLARLTAGKANKTPHEEPGRVRISNWPDADLPTDQLAELSDPKRSQTVDSSEPFLSNRTADVARKNEADQRSAAFPGNRLAQTSPNSTEAADRQFFEDYDAQLEQLRASLNQDRAVAETATAPPTAATAQTATPPTSAFNPREGVRSKVVSMMKRARQQQAAGNWNEAYQTASAAQRLAENAGLIFGPDEDQPAVLVGRIQRRLSEQQSVAANNPQGSVSRPVANLPVIQSAASSRNPAGSARPPRSHQETQVGGAAQGDFSSTAHQEMIVESDQVPRRLSDRSRKLTDIASTGTSLVPLKSLRPHDDDPIVRVSANVGSDLNVPGPPAPMPLDQISGANSPHVLTTRVTDGSRELEVDMKTEFSEAPPAPNWRDLSDHEDAWAENSLNAIRWNDEQKQSSDEESSRGSWPLVLLFLSMAAGLGWYLRRRSSTAHPTA